MMKNLFLVLAAAVAAIFLVAGFASAQPLMAATMPVTAHLQITNDPDSGFCGNWAQDDLLRLFSVRSLGGGEYAVTAADSGNWYAIPGAIAPLNPVCSPHDVMGTQTGTIYGTDTFTVEASGPASQANLDRNLAPYLRDGYLAGADVDYAGTVLALFPAGASFAIGGEFTTWTDTYELLLGSGRTLHGEVMVQADTGYSDTAPYTFTYGAAYGG